MTTTKSISDAINQLSSGTLSISESISLVQSNFTKYIVQPLNAFGFGGFVFDVEGEETTELSSDITDHYVEDNTAVQDHISIKPVKITLKNYVGELVYQGQPSNSGVLQNLTQKLTILDSYLPVLSAQAEQIQAAMTNPDGPDFQQIENSALNLWTLTKNLNPAATRQGQAFAYFKALQQQKLLISVQTPYEFINNMAIERVVAKQGEETKYMSDFSVTLKQLRTVSTKTATFNAANYQGGAAAQAAPEVNQGNTPGASVPQTVLKGLFSTYTAQFQR